MSSGDATWRWGAELGLFGFVGAWAAPNVALFSFLWIGAPFVQFPFTATLAGGVISGLLGFAYGVGAARLNHALNGRRVWLFPLGFPLGSIAGGLSSLAVLHLGFSPRILREIYTGGLFMGVVTGGLVLGLTWVPWVALRSSGRSGGGVLSLAVLGVPIVSVVVVFLNAVWEAFVR